jgi:hypothetical protein
VSQRRRQHAADYETEIARPWRCGKSWLDCGGEILDHAEWILTIGGQRIVGSFHESGEVNRARYRAGRKSFEKFDGEFLRSL